MSQVEHFTFQLLSKPQLLEILSEIGVSVVEDDLANPVDWKVKQIFEKLIEKILNKTREDYAQVDFYAAERLENPELHDVSVPMINFYKLCQKLLATAGDVVPGTSEVDFGLHDLCRPDKKRLRQHLSAVGNFVMFMGDKEGTFIEMAERTGLLREQKEKLEAECARLEKLRDHCQSFAARVPVAAELHAMTLLFLATHTRAVGLFGRRNKRRDRALGDGLTAFLSLPSPPAEAAAWFAQSDLPGAEEHAWSKIAELLLDVAAMVGLFEYNPPLILEALERAGRLVRPAAK
jgi:hypothetical protein